MWSVSGSGCSGNACGTLSAVTSTSVTYTAPTAGGTYLVTATSVADVTRSASATIGVTDLPGVFTYRNDGTRYLGHLHEPEIGLAFRKSVFAPPAAVLFCHRRAHERACSALSLSDDLEERARLCQL
jgi:hypothetical protein